MEFLLPFGFSLSPWLVRVACHAFIGKSEDFSLMFGFMGKSEDSSLIRPVFDDLALLVIDIFAC